MGDGDEQIVREVWFGLHVWDKSRRSYRRIVMGTPSALRTNLIREWGPNDDAGHFADRVFSAGYDVGEVFEILGMR